MNFALDEHKLKSLFEDLVKTTTSPSFLNEMNRVAHSEVDKKYDAADEVANTEHLISKGVRLPSNFRISLRNFEIPLDTSEVEKKIQEPMVCFEAGCASVLYNGTLVSVALDDNKSQEQLSEEQIKTILLKEFKGLSEFVMKIEFQELLKELYSLPEGSRDKFVLDVILNSAELQKRNIYNPNNVYFRRSYFTDNRPTLFCVAKRTPLARPWDKVTITFDNN